ncbi:MAG TPA: hypothetical protein VMR28_00480 [Candidatus Saccharimonadales bacterium]|nr:hypothetical protein [Candidatus Saccharimonadales bacterium]
MDTNNRWMPGLIAVLIVIVISVGGYGIFRYHKDHSTVLPPPSTSPGVGQDGSGGNPTNPSPTPAPTPSCWTATQSWNEIGQTGCVTFTGYADTSDSGQMYLNQDSSDYADGFSVWIPSGESFGQSVLSQYSGQSISVSGTITQYKNAPEIEVTSASQIQLAQ